MAKHTLEFDLKLNTLVRKISAFELEGHDYREVLSQYLVEPFHYQGTLEDFEINGVLDVFVVINCRGKSKKLTLSLKLDGNDVFTKPKEFVFDKTYRGVIRIPEKP